MRTMLKTKGLSVGRAREGTGEGRARTRISYGWRAIEDCYDDLGWAGGGGDQDAAGRWRWGGGVRGDGRLLLWEGGGWRGGCVVGVGAGGREGWRRVVERRGRGGGEERRG